MSVTFQELDGSPTFDVTVTGAKVTRQFKVAWGDIDSFIAETLGSADNDISNAVCSSCKISRHPGQNLGFGSWSSYESAIVIAVYDTWTHPTVTESFSPSAEFLTLDCENFKWASDDTELVPEEAPGRLITTLDYTQTWKNLSTIGTTMFNLIGHVNNAAINFHSMNALLSNISYPAQTLLFHPPTIEKSYDPISKSFKFGVTYRFTYRPNWDGDTARGWNYFWRAATGTFDSFQRIDTSEDMLIYPVANFTVLY